MIEAIKPQVADTLIVPPKCTCDSHVRSLADDIKFYWSNQIQHFPLYSQFGIAIVYWIHSWRNRARGLSEVACLQCKLHVDTGKTFALRVNVISHAGRRRWGLHYDYDWISHASRVAAVVLTRWGCIMVHLIRNGSSYAGTTAWAHGEESIATAHAHKQIWFRVSMTVITGSNYWYRTGLLHIGESQRRWRWQHWLGVSC